VNKKKTLKPKFFAQAEKKKARILLTQ